MKITAVMTNPVQFTPGLPDVLIPFTVQAPAIFKSVNLDAVRTTQEALEDENWGDEACRTSVESELTTRFAELGEVEVEVLTLPEWNARESARIEAESARIEAKKAAQDNA